MFGFLSQPWGFTNNVKKKNLKNIANILKSFKAWLEFRENNFKMEGLHKILIFLKILSKYLTFNILPSVAFNQA